MISVPSGEVMISVYWLRAMPMYIVRRELFSNLIVLKMMNYDGILEMDFLDKYNTSIEYHCLRVIFRPEDIELFDFLGESTSKKSKVFLTALEARKLLLQGCMGYLAHVLDKRMEEKLKINYVPIIQDFPKVFLEDLPGLPPDREIDFEFDLVPGTDRY